MHCLLVVQQSQDTKSSIDQGLWQVAKKYGEKKKQSSKQGVERTVTA